MNYKYKVGDYFIFLGKEDKGEQSYYNSHQRNKSTFKVIGKITSFRQMVEYQGQLGYTYDAIRDDGNFRSFTVDSDIYYYSRKITEQEAIAWCI